MRVPSRSPLLCFASGAAAALLGVASWGRPAALSQPAAAAPGEVTPAVNPAALWRPRAAAVPDDGKVRVIAFGAHPDDCELKAGGVGAMWAAAGHRVMFVSVTNGDIGHWGMAGGPLAQRRLAEVREADRLLGVEAHVMDNHDGELFPTLENRKALTRLIREWKADLVLGHRPNDYHPDHRTVGQLVQDAAFMVTVPHFCPEVPYLEKNPVFMYYEDHFAKPLPFKADVAVAIDAAVGKKLDAVGALRSQFYEGGATGDWRRVPAPANAAATAAREKEVREDFDRHFAAPARRFGLELANWYGADGAAKAKYVEAFEVCEYGRMPTKGEIKKLFPFFP